MVDECVDDRFASVDQIHYAFGQPRLLEQLVDVAHGEGDAFGRLEDEGVAGGYSVWQIPERNHTRKVKGNDSGSHAEGLADHHLVDAAGYVFQVVALHHHRNAASYFDVLDCAAHLGFGFGEGFAIFLRDDAGDVVDVVFEQHLQPEERLDAVFGRGAAPFGESGGGGFDGLVDFGGIG